jgi:uncharacterized protein YqeY
MTLKQQLRNDLVNAMKSGDTARRDALRLLSAAIKQVEVDTQADLSEEEVLSVITKQVKQRRESISDYEAAGRDDLVAQEQVELAIFEAYLPQQLTREEIRAAAEKIIAETGVTEMAGMGQVMLIVIASFRVIV